MTVLQRKQKFSTLVLTLGVLFLAQSVSATLNSVTYSPSDFYSKSGTTVAPVINAGMTDAIASITCTGNTLCDSCGSTTAALSTYTGGFGPLCSLKEVNTNLNLTITGNFTPTTVPTTTYFVMQISSSSATTIVSTGDYTAPTATLATGSNVNLSYVIPWAHICNYAGATTACTASFTATITFGWSNSSTAFSGGETGTLQINYRYVKTSGTAGVAPYTSPWATFGPGPTTNDYQGFYSFLAFPGDQKVYILNPTTITTNSYDVSNLSGSGTSPGTDASGLKYSGIRVFYKLATSSTAAAFTASGGGQSGTDDTQDLTLDTTNGSITPKSVTGLKNLNGTTQEYQFVIASIDQAGILTYWTNPNGTSPNAMNFAITPTGTTQAAQPQPVYGLLDGQGCFIATAAYGSILQPEVATLRAFRSKILLQSEWGQSFVRWYYHNSPTYAQKLSQHEAWRFVVRGMLWPLVWFADLALWLGLWPAIAIVVGLLVLLVLTLSWWQESRRVRS